MISLWQHFQPHEKCSKIIETKLTSTANGEKYDIYNLNEYCYRISENYLTKNKNYLIVNSKNEDIAFILLLNEKVSRIKSSRV